MLGLEQYLERKPRSAVRRPAAAGRDGPCDRPRAAGVPDGRAAVEPRRQAPRVHARLAEPAARAARRHDGVRDARPGRGHDARRPGLRAARGHAAAGRHPAEPLRQPGEPVRGRVHRLARDELRRPPSSYATTARTPSFAGYKLPVPPRRWTHKPGLDDYFGKRRHPRHPAVRLRGRRPAARTGRWARMHAKAVTEELGSEINVIFTIDAPPVRAQGHRRPGPGRHGRRRGRDVPLADNKALWTARVNARSRIQPGQHARARRRQPQPALLRPLQRPGHRQRSLKPPCSRACRMRTRSGRPCLMRCGGP